MKPTGATRFYLNVRLIVNTRKSGNVGVKITRSLCGKDLE